CAIPLGTSIVYVKKSRLDTRVLAGTPPWELEAEMLDETHRVRIDRQARGERLALEEVGRVQRMATRRMRDRWKASLEDALYGKRTIEAIRPVLGQWIQRKHGSLSFRLVQIMTGHGCFGHYLHRVARREPTPSCHECGAADDTAQHTLEECSRWDPQRHTLVAEIGGDLSLPSVVFAMLSSERSWEAVVDFCEEVISQKEAAERMR
ncbi:jg22442, partial [Pararge aegeria aegeria]